MTTLPKLLRAQAKANPAQPFLFFKDQTWTLSELDAASDGVAGVLHAAKLNKGDRVGILLPNCPEYVLCLFGIWKAGFVAVPINAQLKEPEIEHILKDSGCAFIFVDAARPKINANIKLRAMSAGAPKDGLLHELKGAIPEAADFDVASLIYTSGTTGFPKGAVLTHANYLFDVERFVEAIKMTEADRFLCFLPLFHVNGQVVTLLSPLLAGGSMVLMERFQPKEFFELLSRHRCTAFSGVPSIYSVLLSLPDAAKYDLSSLRFCICGAAPMPVEVIRAFEEKFKAHILEGYGLSEATCVSSINPPPPGKRKAGSIGVSLKGQDMRITDGEIEVRGPNVMRGYWNNETATKSSLVDGWLKTGDLGSVDSDGYFYVIGRKKEMIIRGGENIYPKEIEEALYKHPAVAEAAVVGLPDKRWGEEVAAFIVLREGKTCTAKEITAHLKDKVADFKLPRRVEFLASLPKTATGKIQKLKLRGEYS